MVSYDTIFFTKLILLKIQKIQVQYSWKINTVFSKVAETALFYYEAAFWVNKNLFGENCSEVGNILYRICECYFNMDKMDEALEHHLEIRRIIYDANSEFIVDSLEKLKEYIRN